MVARLARLTTEALGRGEPLAVTCTAELSTGRPFLSPFQGFLASYSIAMVTGRLFTPSIEMIRLCTPDLALPGIEMFNW